jgi:signal peptidase I
MRPFIRSGAKILQESVRPDQIEVGDVITFRQSPGISVTHRVVRIFGEAPKISFWTMGDSGHSLDPVVLPHHLIARVTHIDQVSIRRWPWRWMGRLLSFAAYSRYRVLRRLALLK